MAVPGPDDLRLLLEADDDLDDVVPDAMSTDADVFFESLDGLALRTFPTAPD